MKFPKRIKHRGRVLAKIYGKSKSYPAYRVAWTVTGRRLMKAFGTYSSARRHADDLVNELAKGSPIAADHEYSRSLPLNLSADVLIFRVNSFQRDASHLPWIAPVHYRSVTGKADPAIFAALIKGHSEPTPFLPSMRLAC